ncbi:MazF family transcriptional regulator [Bacillus coahuilensis m2-6]|nr:MazF family transcriptional regulator [Bacillus coahuilensis m2-6]
MYNQGDIVLIPVPFSDLTNRKQRPVLIISNDDYNKITEDIVVVAITSQLRDLDYSVVRADKVYTLSKNIVRKKFGRVNAEVIYDVQSKLNALIRGTRGQ